MKEGQNDLEKSESKPLSLELQRENTRDTAAWEPTEKERISEDKIYVTFEEGDPENPYNWSQTRKWITVVCTSFAAFSSASVGTSFSMGDQALESYVHTSREMTFLAFAMFNLGFGLGPLLLSPLSESFGRMPVAISTLAIATICGIPIALGPHIAVQIIFRFMLGFFSSTGSSMVGGIISDMFHAQDRGWPMFYFACNTFSASGIYPLAMSFAVERRGYEFMAWMHLLIIGASTLLFLLAKESRGSVLLSRRAAKLRKETGDPRYVCKADEERASFAVLVSVSLARPVKMLLLEPVVIMFSLYVAFAWANLFIALESVNLIFSGDYGFSLSSVGLVFVAADIACAINVALYKIQDMLFQRSVDKRGPEARLYLAMMGGFCLPAGLLIFGFAQGRGHWMGPAVGLAVLITGIVAIYVATFLYMADAFGAYASSAMAAQSLLRNIFATAFPLFTTQMFNGMGFTWAPFLAAMVGILLAVVPFLLYRWGATLRAKSEYR